MDPLTSNRRTFLGASALGLTGLVVAPAASAAGNGLAIRRLAWAGLQLRLGNVALFIDAVPPDPEGGQPGPELTSDAARNFALVTHHHGDHCNPKALKPVLGERGYMVALEETARLFDSRTVTVQPVNLYEPVFLSRTGGEFVAWPAPAADGFGNPQVSWVVDAGGKRIIHCGDTIWHGHWWDIARAYGPFDVAFLPINGLRQIQGRFTDSGQPMGLSAEQAAAAASILGARLAVPIHYGSKGDPNYIEQPNAEQVFLRETLKLKIRSKVFAPGEILQL
ncbi:MAG: MBL fold metallo-hydrolase [Caulobacteraceae bacterium]